MTFEPGGEAHIPNQIGTSGRPQGGSRPAPGSPQAFLRSVLMVAVVNAVLISAALVGVYVLELTDPDIGIWWILAAMVPGILLLTVTVLRYQRQRARYLQSPEGSLAAGSATTVSGGPVPAAGSDPHQGGVPRQARTPGSDGPGTGNHNRPHW